MKAKGYKYSRKCGSRTVHFRKKKSARAFDRAKKRAKAQGRVSTFCRRWGK